MHVQRTLWLVASPCLLALFASSSHEASQAPPAAIAAPAAQTFPNGLVLEGATLVSPERARPLADAAIVIRGNRIEAVGPRGSVTYPPNAHVLRLQGRYVIPGLIDSHLHLQGWDMELFLANGITSVLEQSSSSWVYAVRDGIASGNIRGPRMFVSNNRLHGGNTAYAGFGFLDMWGNGIAYDGIGPADLQEVRGMDRGRDDGLVTTPEQGRDAVRRLVGRGADAIKVHHNLDREVLKAIVEEAHRAKIPVVGHRIDARETAELGMDFVEHTSPVAIATITSEQQLQALREGKILDPHYLMDPAAFAGVIEKLVKAKVYLNPTLSGGWRPYNGRQQEYAKEVTEYFSQPALQYVPPERVQKYFNDFTMLDRLSPDQAALFKDGYRKVQRFVKEFAQAGGRLLAGSDPANTGVPGLGIHQEMELMVDAGVSPMEALKSATIYAAQLMRKESLLGTIEPGKLADVVVLSANPLDAIENTQKVGTVIIDGRVVDTSFHSDYEIPIRNPAEPKTGLRSSTPARLRLDGVTPDIVKAGSRDVEIEIIGKVLPSSTVLFNGKEIPLSFVNPRKAKAVIPSQLIQRVGTYPVEIASPMFRGGTDKSNALYLIVGYR